MTNSLEERELLQRIADLPREIRPQNDPWAAISARLGHPGSERRERFSRRGWMPWAAAASLALALAAGLLLGPRLTESPLFEPGSKVVLELHAPAPESHQIAVTLAASEAEYQAAFREFIAIGHARPSLSPQTIATIESGWADLRETESALAAALAVNPDDRFLSDRMLELRARQLGFLRELASLDQSNRRLTI